MEKASNEPSVTDISSKLSRRKLFEGALAGLVVATAPSGLAEAKNRKTSIPALRVAEAASKADANHAIVGTAIGNYHAYYPGGIAFVQDNAIGIVLDIGWDANNRPSIAAPDYSYNRITWQEGFTTVMCEWGRADETTAVCRLTSNGEVLLKLNLPKQTWHPFNAVYYSVPEGLDATAITADGRFVSWKLRVAPAPEQNDTNTLPEASFVVNLTPEQPIFMAAGFGELPELSSAGAKLDEAAARYKAMRASASGDWGDFVTPITDNLNNSKLYSSVSRQIMHIVGRKGWVPDPDYPPIFCWDSFFNALLASIEDPEGARRTVRGIFLYQTPEGMVANVAGWQGTRSGTMTIGNSQPPVGSLCVWKVHQRWPDRAFLAEIYPKLLKWHDWWPKYSDGNHDGLLEWGSSTGIFQEARFGTGWDDSPQWQDVRMIGTQMNVDAVDLNSMWAMDAKYLALIAAELGDTAESQRLRDQHSAMNERMNRLLWNEELGTYCHRFWSTDGKLGRFVTQLTPANFYPLLCGAPDQARANRMLAIFANPKKFWGEWIIPTLPYDDPDWPKQHYWQGHIWAPVNYLLWQGVQNYCTPRQKGQFVRRSIDLFMRNWTKFGTCNENYRSTDGSGDDYPHYTWGALLCQIGVESLYSIDEHGSPQPMAAIETPEQVVLRNMPAGGILYRIERNHGKTRITAEQPS